MKELKRYLSFKEALKVITYFHITPKLVPDTSGYTIFGTDIKITITKTTPKVYRLYYKYNTAVEVNGFRKLLEKIFDEIV